MKQISLLDDEKLNFPASQEVMVKPYEACIYMSLKRKLLSVLIIILCLFLFPLIANAEIVSSGYCGANLNFTLDNEGVLSISGTGEMDDFNSNSAPWGKSVKEVYFTDGATSIGSYAFYKCTELRNISFPNSLKLIGSNAFYHCDRLQCVALPASLETIEQYAFGMCGSIRMFIFPNSMKSFGDYAFFGCDSLTTVSIPEGISTIPKDLFLGDDNLEYVSLPDSVTSIEEEAFCECLNVKIQIPDTVTNFGDNIFQDSPNAVIYCNEFSLAESYARTNGYKVVLLDSLNENDASIIFSIDAERMEINETAHWHLSSFPYNETVLSGFTFASSNNSIAEINQDGTITGKKRGTVTISAINNGNVYSKELIVYKRCNSFKMKSNDLGGIAGDTIKLEAITTPADCDILWKAHVSDAEGNNAYVSGGIIDPDTGLFQLPQMMLGDMYLTITDEYSGLSTIATLSVFREPYRFSFENDEYVLCQDETQQIYVELEQIENNPLLTERNRCVSFSSSDTSIVTINENGVIKGISQGSAEVYATMGTRTTSTKVLVIVPMTEFAFVNDVVYVEAKGQKSIPLTTVTPENADSRFQWNIDNPLIATVDESIISGQAIGTTTLSATDVFTGITREIPVTVRYPVDSVVLSESSVLLTPGEKLYLTAKAFARGVEYAEEVFTFDSSDNSIVTVDESGCVTALAPGATTITTQSENGTTSICEVTVESIVFNQLEFDKAEMTIITDEKYTTNVYGNQNHEFRVNHLVSFISRNPEIASVDEHGIIHGMKAGTTTILATVDSGVTASINITVREAYTLRLPTELKEIEAGAFAGAAFEVVIIPNDCTKVGDYAFYNCKELRLVKVSINTEIAANAFEGSPNVVIERIMQ